MKRLFRKNQIIITSLAIMIVIAGYLNFTADQTKPVKQEAAAETAEKIREENIQAEEAAAGAEADITSFPDEDLASVSAEAESTAFCLSRRIQCFCKIKQRAGAFKK